MSTKLTIEEIKEKASGCFSRTDFLNNCGGAYWHSVPGLKRSRIDWPEEDLENYHQIKDQYFKSKGIELLHISEKEWLENKEKCIKKCLEFLGE